MLTYQLQPRVFRVEVANSFTFPNELTLELKYGPGTSFGTQGDHSRTLVMSRAAELSYNANTGRMLARSDPPLGPLEVVITSPETTFELKGDVLRYRSHCQRKQDLEGVIAAFHYVFPTLLNLVMPEPPVVEYTKGWVGDVEFRWEHQEARAPMHVVTEESLDKAVAEAYEYLSLFTGFSNRRLAAALHYVHRASRLIVSGSSDWEFMSEAILNFCKALEMLFVQSENSREDVRKGLRSLEYEGEEIEGDFVPLLVLRGFLDVAHARVAIHRQDQLLTLYRFLSESEGRFRRLLARVIERTKEGSFKVPVVVDPTLDSKDRARMDKLIETLQRRIRG